MLTTIAILALMGLLPPQHPPRRAGCRAASAVALAGALRLHSMAVPAARSAP